MTGRAGEFRLEVAVGAGLTALRRFGWLIGLVMLADGGLEIAARMVGERLAFLGVDSEFSILGVWLAQRLSAVFAAAVVYLLVIAAAREEPLRPLKLLRALASGLLTVLLAEAVYSLPGTIAAEVFASDRLAQGAVRFVAGLYHLALFLSLSLLVPAVLDRRLTLSDGIDRSLALLKGRRWPLFLMVSAPLVAIAIVRRLTVVSDPSAPLEATWPFILLCYPVYGLSLVAIASVYLESSAANGDEPEHLAETFD